MSIQDTMPFSFDKLIVLAEMGNADGYDKKNHNNIKQSVACVYIVQAENCCDHKFITLALKFFRLCH